MKKVAFKGGLLIDGTGAEPVVNSLVLTEDDKIAYAGADKEIGPDYEVVDITGKTIMPGLIDSHLHFSGNLTDDDSDWVLEDVVQKTVVAVQQAHECLENGLTTVGEISRSGIQIRNMVEAAGLLGKTTSRNPHSSVDYHQSWRADLWMRPRRPWDCSARWCHLPSRRRRCFSSF